MNLAIYPENNPTVSAPFSVKTLAILLVFMGMALYLRLGHWDSRMAHTSEAMATYYMQGTDPTQIHWRSEQLSSLVLPLPALLYRVGIPISVSLALLTCLQYTLLGLAFFYYVRTLTRRDDVAWLALFLHLCISPFNWNLAGAGESLLIYPSEIVLAPILFAVTSLIQQKTTRMVIALLLAGWLQPSLTLYALGLIGPYWVWTSPPHRWRRVLIMAALGLWTLVPAISLMKAAPNPLSTAEFAAYLKYWLHGAIWLYPFYFLPTLYGFATYVVIFFLAFRSTPLASKPWWLWILAATLIGPLLLAAIGALVPAPLITRSMPLRVTGLFVLLTLPIILLWLRDKLVSASFGQRWIAASALLIPCVIGTPLVWMIVLLLMLAQAMTHEQSAGKERAWHEPLLTGVGVAAVLGWALSLYDMSQSSLWAMPQWTLWADFQAATRTAQGIGLTALLLIAAACVAVATAFRRVAVTLILLAGITLARMATIGHFETRTPKEMERIALLEWVRDHTSADARFVTTWPVVRATIGPRDEIYTASMVLGYLITQQHIDTMNRLHAFYSARVPEFKSWAEKERFPETYSAIRAFRTLNEKQIQEFAAEFRVDYLIRESFERPLKFPVAYRNDTHIIYRLPTPST